MTEINSCPLCGKRPPLSYDMRGKVRCICKNCDIHGVASLDVVTAIDNWNYEAKLYELGVKRKKRKK